MRCIVKNCFNNVSHTFPNKKNREEIRKKWLIAVGKKEEEIKVSHGFCQKHFTKDDYTHQEIDRKYFQCNILFKCAKKYLIWKVFLNKIFWWFESHYYNSPWKLLQLIVFKKIYFPRKTPSTVSCIVIFCIIFNMPETAEAWKDYRTVFVWRFPYSFTWSR